MCILILNLKRGNSTKITAALHLKDHKGIKAKHVAIIIIYTISEGTCTKES